jgi:hypothetical protein
MPLFKTGRVVLAPALVTERPSRQHGGGTATAVAVVIAAALPLRGAALDGALIAGHEPQVLAGKGPTSAERTDRMDDEPEPLGATLYELRARLAKQAHSSVPGPGPRAPQQRSLCWRVSWDAPKPVGQLAACDE